jgi:hypothetical protein
LNQDEKVVGYVAFHPSLQMFCEDGACIVSGTQSSMNKYLKSSDSDPKEFEKRKTLYFQIVDGMDAGGFYVFDRDSYKMFSPLAKKLGLKLAVKEKPSIIAGQSFTFVGLEKL